MEETECLAIDDLSAGLDLYLPALHRSHNLDLVRIKIVLPASEGS